MSLDHTDRDLPPELVPDEHGEVHCDAVLERVTLFIDSELSTASVDTIRAHLAACEQCLDAFDVEQAVKDLVRRSCSGERAPDALRLRIVTAITEVRFD